MRKAVLRGFKKFVMNSFDSFIKEKTPKRRSNLAMGEVFEFAKEYIMRLGVKSEEDNYHILLAGLLLLAHQGSKVGAYIL